MEDAARRQKWRTWQPDSAAERIGRGAYGSVYRTRGGCALKVVRGRDRNGRRQAYREHVAGLLQTLLVLRGITAGLALHYGAAVTPLPSGELCVSMHMELYEASLDSPAGARLLRAAPSAALPLLFQTGAALHAMARCFHVAHNDLYPRNVLLRRGRSGAVALYRIQGHERLVPRQLQAVVADFGVCAGPALQFEAPVERWDEHAPEVARALPQLEAPRRFRAAEHVLRFCRALPPHARDLYPLLCWAAEDAPSDEPRRWAQEALTLLDERREELVTSDGLLTLLLDAFGPLAERCGAPCFLKGGAADETFELKGDEGPALWAEARAALHALQTRDTPPPPASVRVASSKQSV